MVFKLVSYLFYLKDIYVIFVILINIELFKKRILDVLVS